jgi:hypothetical protein
MEQGARTIDGCGLRPAEFCAGEAYQFDWSHEVVLLNGVTVMVKAAHVRLCHSRMLFVRAYPRETQEMVFDAHDRAFALFKGTCGRGIYDNMKTAVETIFVGKGRLYNRRFLQMCSHYLVEPVACTPASGGRRATSLDGSARLVGAGPCDGVSSVGQDNASGAPAFTKEIELSEAANYCPLPDSRKPAGESGIDGLHVYNGRRG